MASIFGIKLYILILIIISLLLGFFLLFFFYLRKKLSNDDDHTVELINATTTVLPVFPPPDMRVVKWSDGQMQEKSEDSDGFVKGRSVSDESVNSRLESSSALSKTSDFSGERMNWGRFYRMVEMEIATNWFSEECVIGKGGYGVVFRGVLRDGLVVAIKNLRDNKGQAEKEFKAEVEAIGKVRHKHLVGLIGYCAEGEQRFLVYEYINNGNLEQWLHGDVGPVSPLTWEIRMKIAIGTARGLAYLHEGLEPKVIHRDIKSSNILLDKQWTPKVSDFGLAKLLGSEKSFVATRVMGTFGYVSPEYANTGMLNEANDVYSFGILLMEIVTGRYPVDYSKPPAEVNLVDWVKAMVSNRRAEELIDPLIKVPPPTRSLKRILLVCLRCIDVDANKRPKMGHVVHMLEADEFPSRVILETRPVLDTAPLYP